MRKRLLPAAIFCSAVVFTLVVRPSGPGMQIKKTAVSYLSFLEEEAPEQAHQLLSDSLRLLVLPAFLGNLRDAPSDGVPALKHWEPRGFVVSLVLEAEGTRTLWLVRESGKWRISGDTSLDNLLGSAAVICRDYAETNIVPLLRSGADLPPLSCPVTGQPYVIVDGDRLVCQAGHLGEGLYYAGSRCEARRDSLSDMIGEFLSEGFDMPSSFEEIYSVSEGRFGQPGGYRCPDHGYSYYEIRDEQVFCPWHGESSPVRITEGE